MITVTVARLLSGRLGLPSVAMTLNVSVGWVKKSNVSTVVLISPVMASISKLDDPGNIKCQHKLKRDFQQRYFKCKPFPEQTTTWLYPILDQKKWGEIHSKITTKIINS